MKVDNIEHEKNRVKVRRNRVKSILDWGDTNDYPQSVLDIVNSSYTGSACLDIYHKFIYGHGFADKDNYQIVVNEEGETADSLLDAVAGDYATFGGFALHLNRNLLGQITEMRYIPLENIRICPDDDKVHRGQVAVHPDWGLRTDKMFNSTPIEYFNLYDPDTNVFLDRVAKAGGILSYKGEVFYYTNQRGNYPLPIFDSVLTDMSTQEAISNTNYRSAKRSFLPAGCFAEINEYFDENNKQDKEQFDAVSDALRGLQGDKNACSIMHVVVKSKDEIPQMIALRGENFDKEYTVTREAAKQAIGQAFRQPEELRCERTKSGFANDVMVQAYKVYNSTTSKERQTLEREFTKLFKNWYIQIEYNFQIMPLSYGAETILSRLGPDATTEMVKVATNVAVATETRKQILILVYGLEEDEANSILQLNSQQKHANND